VQAEEAQQVLQGGGDEAAQLQGHEGPHAGQELLLLLLRHEGLHAGQELLLLGPAPEALQEGAATRQPPGRAGGRNHDGMSNT